MIKNSLGMITLFVKNPAVSADFYSKIFGMQAAYQSPTFVMFILNGGVKLGLWIVD